MLDIWSILNFIIWLAICLTDGYLWFIAIAGIKPIRRSIKAPASYRFAIAIPAHNEASVIGPTVSRLKQLEYPKELYEVFVVADNCNDETPAIARAQGATCFERKSSVRSGKGAALRWLFDRIFELGDYEAVVVFDADTQVNLDFLQVMNDRLENGAQVVQGRHVISNPRQGWFPALTWAMMTIDCRLYSQGRANLGFSARHMGDSICFRTQVLKELGWGSGLTEDYELRLRLLLAGICIQYEPRAIGYGQAPVTLLDAQAQRLRWARGVTNTSRSFRRELFIQGIKRRDPRLIDGGLSITLPSYSLLTLLSVGMLILSLLLFPLSPSWLIYCWLGLLASLFFYPWFGLALEHAPGWAYLAIMSGPVFILWRSWINLQSRLKAGSIRWVRTPHRG